MSMPEVQRPGHIPGLGVFGQLATLSSDRTEVERPGKSSTDPDFDSRIAEIRNKHDSIPRRVGFALTVLATGGLAYLFKKGVSALALHSQFQGFLPGAYAEKRAELKKTKNEFLEKTKEPNSSVKNSTRTLSYSIPTVDKGGGKLDAAIVFSDLDAALDFKGHLEEKKKPIENDFWIVKLNGNNGFYEDCMGTHDQNREAVEDALRETHPGAKVNVAMFNYRGVGESTGSADCADDLVLDGITMCQFLLDKGIPAERILLDGMSMGGMAATKAYGFFNARQQRVNLVRERTFGELRNAAKEFSSSYVGEKRGLGEKLGAAAKYIFHATNWRGNAEKVLKKKEEEEEEWGNVLELYHSEDEIMKNSSLTEAVAKHKKNVQEPKTVDIVEESQAEAIKETDDSIIQLPSRMEAAKAYFSKVDWISDPETKSKTEADGKRIERSIKNLESAKEKNSDKLASLRESSKEKEQLLKLYETDPIFKELVVCGGQYKECKTVQEFLCFLENYGKNLNLLIKDLRRREASLLLIKRLELQQATIDWCKGIMSTHMVHNLNFSDTDTWKTGVIPKIADLFNNAAKVPVQPHDLYG